MLTLAYYREYRTYFHLAQDVNLSELNVCRTIHKIEKILIKSGLFNLPGKQYLQSEQLKGAELVIDVTEIERPKTKQKKL